MRFELGLEEPHPAAPCDSAATIAVSYIAGGLIPLAPYMLMPQASDGAAVLGHRDHSGAGHLRIRQGALHGEPRRC